MSTTITSPTADGLRAAYASTVADLRNRLSSYEAMTREWIETDGEYSIDEDGVIRDVDGKVTDLETVRDEHMIEILRSFINEFDAQVTFSLDGEYLGTVLRQTLVGATPAHTVTLLVDTQLATITLMHDEFGRIEQASFTDSAAIDDECLVMFDLARG